MKNPKTPTLALKRFDLFEEIMRVNEPKDLQFMHGVLRPGVTLIEETSANLPLYLALRISTGRFALDAIQVTESKVSYLVTSEISSRTHGNASKFKKKKDEALVNFSRTSEDAFWASPIKVLSLIGNSTCVFVEVSDEDAFVAKRELIDELDAKAKAKGIAVVLACKWRLDNPMGLPAIQVQAWGTGLNFSLRIPGTQPLDLSFSWDYTVSDYRFDAFKGKSKKESTVGFYQTLGYSDAEMVEHLGIAMATIHKYQGRSGHQSSAA